MPGKIPETFDDETPMLKTLKEPAAPRTRIDLPQQVAGRSWLEQAAAMDW
jgi:hypothetical protein